MKPAGHLAVLDGWRGISILLVLAAHLLPLGPKPWSLNVAAGVTGMVLFFTLSGFLITTVLLRGSTIVDFLVRRVFRIIPLAWLYVALTLAMAGASSDAWLAHLLFHANLPPKQLIPVTDHMWSVCMEMQFYVGIALLVALCGVRGLLVLPALCVAFTAFRIVHGIPLSTITWFRIDEILAGCTLALIYHRRLAPCVRRLLAQVPQWLLLGLMLASCLRQLEWLNYARPYLAAMLVGATLLNPGTTMAAVLRNRILAYLAGISYALYVIHPLLAHSWLGSGDLFEKYAKRPLLFAVLFCLAHLSTHYYEKRWIEFGKSLTAKVRRPAAGGQTNV